MTTDVIQNAATAVVTVGGTTAPVAGTVETWTITGSGWTVLAAGQVMRLMDFTDLDKTSGFEVMEATANANGTGVSWTVTRGVEGTTPRAHAANWVVIPVLTAGALDGRYGPPYPATGARPFTTQGGSTLDDGSGNATIAGRLSANNGLATGVTGKNTSALPYTTLPGDDFITLTGSTAGGTLTLGTTGFVSGQVQEIYNASTVSVTLAAATGSIDNTVLPPSSGVIMQWRGAAAWSTIGSYALNENSSNRATFTTPTPTSGTAFTPSATADCVLYIKCTTSTSLTVTIGPSTGAEHTIVGAVTAPVGGFYPITVPMNWKVIVTGTIADFTFGAQTL